MGEGEERGREEGGVLTRCLFDFLRPPRMLHGMEQDGKGRGGWGKDEVDSKRYKIVARDFKISFLSGLLIHYISCGLKLYCALFYDLCDNLLLVCIRIYGLQVLPNLGNIGYIQ